MPTMKLNEFKTSEENFNYSLLTQPYGKFYIDNSKRGELIEYILDMKAQNKDFGLLERHLSKTDYEPLYCFSQRYNYSTAYYY